SKKDSPTHRDAVIRKFISHCVIAEIHRQDQNRKSRQERETQQHIVNPERPVGPFDRLNAPVLSGSGHGWALTYAFTSTAFAISPECIVVNASFHSSSFHCPPIIRSIFRLPDESSCSTRSQIGQLWLKLPCKRRFFCTSGSSEWLNG